MIVHEKVIERVTGTDTVDVSEIDSTGRAVRMTTSYRGLTFDAHVTDQQIVVGGFPTLDLSYSNGGSLLSIRGAEKEIASYQYDKSGSVTGVRLDTRYSLQFKYEKDGNVRQTLHAGGKALRDQVTTGRAARRPSFDIYLDPIAATLGLPDDWTDHVKRRSNATGSVLTLSDDVGRDLLYIFRFGDLYVGYSLTGEPLFLQLNLVRTTYSGSQAIGIPTIFTVTAGGSVGLHVEIVPQRGIEGFWTGGGAHNGVLEYRYSSTDETTSRVRSDLLYICDQTTVCSLYFGTEYCTTTRYWCADQSSSGGSYDPSDPPIVGSTTTTTPVYRANHLGNTPLGAEVDKAITGAISRLKNQTCTQTFGLFKTPAGKTAAEVLQGLGKTPTSYMLDYMNFYNGSNQSACTGTAVAFTTPGSRLVYICPLFATYDNVAAQRLIHEELHSLGMAEAPPVQGAPTDAQIDSAIASNCK